VLVLIVSVQIVMLLQTARPEMFTVVAEYSLIVLDALALIIWVLATLLVPLVVLPHVVRININQQPAMLLLTVSAQIVKILATVVVSIVLMVPFRYVVCAMAVPI